MGSKLVEIFAAKRREVEAAQAQTPLAELKARCRDAEPPRAFRKALADAPGLALIAEIKQASPSRGLIRPDLDPAEVAAAYEEAGAQCLSVLTDKPFFQGCAENLYIAKRVSRLPCLRKDFIESPYQVYEARAWGADAILLIVAWLGPAQVEDLAGIARELGMDALVEVHTPEEAQIALACRADLIGVNNRNLATLSEDVSAAGQLLPTVAGGALAVAESGFSRHEELQRAEASGAKAVLIGTAFCLTPDIRAKVREVMGWE
jgi:indole-3-glycerol phosphate synthase